MPDIKSFSEKEKKDLLQQLRKEWREFPIHPLEIGWGINAEIILESISRSSDLTKRGVRGIIAEATFIFRILEPYLERNPDWENINLETDYPYDFLIENKSLGLAARIQVKLQRQEAHAPLKANTKKQFKSLSDDYYIVETQKTRSGKDKNGNSTRPYHFNDFDILAVCMEPTTHDWSVFRYSLIGNLVPKKDDKLALNVLQPVPLTPTGKSEWFADLDSAMREFIAKKSQPS